VGQHEKGLTHYGKQGIPRIAEHLGGHNLDKNKKSDGRKRVEIRGRQESQGKTKSPAVSHIQAWRNRGIDFRRLGALSWNHFGSEHRHTTRGWGGWGAPISNDWEKIKSQEHLLHRLLTDVPPPYERSGTLPWKEVFRFDEEGPFNSVILYTPALSR